MDAHDIVLDDGRQQVRISPSSGGRLSSWEVGGVELLGSGGRPGVFQWGCFAMAPWAGRIRRGRLTWAGHTHQLPLAEPPHALHGTTVDRPWQVVESDGSSASLRCGLDSRWPWRGHVDERVEIVGGAVSLQVSVTSNDTVAFPAWLGWHPWFRRRLAWGDDVRVEVTAAGLLQRDEENIATARVVPMPSSGWDDAVVGVRWPARLRWPAAGAGGGYLVVEIASDTMDAVLYDGRPSAVCVEPQTAPPDAVALGRDVLLEPGGTTSLTMTWTCRGEAA